MLFSSIKVKYIVYINLPALSWLSLCITCVCVCVCARFSARLQRAVEERRKIHQQQQEAQENGESSSEFCGSHIVFFATNC